MQFQPYLAIKSIDHCDFSLDWLRTRNACSSITSGTFDCNTTISVWLLFVFALLGHYFVSFKLLKILCLAKNQWWRFITQSTHMIYMVNLIRFKMVFNDKKILLDILTIWQNRRTEGFSKLKSLEKRHVQERLVSTFEHMRVIKWDRNRCQEE